PRCGRGGPENARRRSRMGTYVEEEQRGPRPRDRASDGHDFGYGTLMTHDVKLPDIGEGVAEGEIVRWLVKVGERVRDDQPLVEVMTDKASVEIPSPRAGTIAALHVAEGQVVPVGTVLISIAVAGEGASTSPP